METDPPRDLAGEIGRKAAERREPIARARIRFMKRRNRDVLAEGAGFEPAMAF